MIKKNYKLVRLLKVSNQYVYEKCMYIVKQKYKTSRVIKEKKINNKNIHYRF